MGIGALTRAVFLDRDGVINEAVVLDGKPLPPQPHELRIVRDAFASLSSLQDAGFALIVVTNQPDIARGTRSAEDIATIHARLAHELPLDAFYVCMHDDADGCDCRKPLPGLLLQAADEHAIDLEHSYIIGDRWKDIAAGHAAGVHTVFIDQGYSEPHPKPAADATVASLQGAVRWILNRENA